MHECLFALLFATCNAVRERQITRDVVMAEVLADGSVVKKRDQCSTRAVPGWDDVVTFCSAALRVKEMRRPSVKSLLENEGKSRNIVLNEAKKDKYRFLQGSDMRYYEIFPVDKPNLELFTPSVCRALTDYWGENVPAVLMPPIHSLIGWVSENADGQEQIDSFLLMMSPFPASPQDIFTLKAGQSKLTRDTSSDWAGERFIVPRYTGDVVKKNLADFTEILTDNGIYDYDLNVGYTHATLPPCDQPDCRCENCTAFADKQHPHVCAEILRPGGPDETLCFVAEPESGAEAINGLRKDAAAVMTGACGQQDHVGSCYLSISENCTATSPSCTIHFTCFVISGLGMKNTESHLEAQKYTAQFLSDVRSKLNEVDEINMLNATGFCTVKLNASAGRYRNYDNMGNKVPRNIQISSDEQDAYDILPQVWFTIVSISASIVFVTTKWPQYFEIIID